MFGRPPKEEAVKLDELALKLLNDMEMFGPDSKEYSKCVKHLERLTNLRKSQDKWRINPDTVALVLGNLLGILVIVAYEQKHVFTSKGLGFILRSK